MLLVKAEAKERPATVFALALSYLTYVEMAAIVVLVPLLLKLKIIDYNQVEHGSTPGVIGKVLPS